MLLGVLSANNGRISAMENRHFVPLLCALAIAGFVTPAQAQNVLTTHRLSAALASEAVNAAVAACAKQGYKVTAAVVDADGVEQAVLRGDGATMTTLGAARDKAYTAFMLGAPRNTDSSGAVASRIGANASAGGLAKLPHILLLQGALVIRAAARPSRRSVSAVRPAAILTKPAPKPESTRSATG
jgi:uncharacterized protein GlcG (DUF336 family)